jgi:hypothetical protein
MTKALDRPAAARRKKDHFANRFTQARAQMRWKSGAKMRGNRARK